MKEKQQEKRMNITESYMFERKKTVCDKLLNEIMNAKTGAEMEMAINNYGAFLEAIRISKSLPEGF